MRVLVIAAVAAVIMLGIVNYLWAVLRARYQKTGCWPGVLYAVLQTVITVLYLSPLALLAVYCAAVNLAPERFIEYSWFGISAAIYFGILVVFIIIGAVLLSKRRWGYYDRETDVFMYAVRHRAVFSFVISAAAAVGMVLGIIGVGAYQERVILKTDDISQYCDQKYLALDLSEVDGSICEYTITTAESCKTLKLRGDPERDYGSLSIVSSAERIVIENISVTDGSEITLCAQASLEIIGDGTFFAALSFSDGAEFAVDGVAMGGSVDFSGSAAIDVRGGASFVSDVYFADSAAVTVSQGSGIDGEIVIAESSSSLSVVGTATDESADEDEEAKGERELFANILFEERTEDFYMNVEGVSLLLRSPIEYNFDSSFNFAARGDGVRLQSLSGGYTLFAKKLNIEIDGGAEIAAPETGGAHGVAAQDARIKGSGALSITGGVGISAAAGGNAVNAERLAIEGSLNVALTGGSGGQGKIGATGATGSTGKKGNNESQGEDTFYGYNGRPGGTGGTGGKGGIGGAGGAALSLLEAPSVGEGCTLVLTGGKGGKGGTGGTGGTGGRGGDGGDDDHFSFIWIGDMSGGEGGSGGPGGAGGPGGEGGLGGCPLLIAGELATLELSYVTELDGDNGDSGENGTTGQPGSKGAHGDPGSGG